MGNIFRLISPGMFGVCLALTWGSCANPTTPEGGPKDISPPEIIAVYPEPNATNVRTDVIKFLFNKFVDRNTFQQSLFMSPVIQNIEYVWKGREVELRLHDSLRVNTTYSITVGTDVRDTRERTRMSQSFTLAFSTGPVIDIGQISGKIYDKEPAGIFIYAYHLGDSAMVDTLNPAKSEPDYITQTGENGEFTLPYLVFGGYRILAIRDQFRNRLYDKMNDAIGVYTNDIALTEENPVYDRTIIRVHKPDRTEPFISRVIADYRNRITIRFSKEIDAETTGVQSFTVVDSSSGQHLQILTTTVRKQTPSEVLLFTEDQDSVTYTLIIAEELADISGNTILSDSRTSVFTGSHESPPGPVGVDYIYPRAGTRGVWPDESIIVQFSHPVLSENPEQLVWIADSNEVVIKGEYRWVDETLITFKPDVLLGSLMPYTISVRLDSLPSVNDIGYVDSVFTSQFTTLDRGNLGTIEGTVLTDDDSYVTVVAERSGTSREAEMYSVTVQSPGMFILERLPQGAYQIWGFIDERQTGEYDYGSVYPFRGSALFAMYDDTVRVRPRWTVDGITLDLRKRHTGNIPDSR
jgi:hypothetical protein